MPAGPGAFEGEGAETFLLHRLTLDSGQDDTTGDTDSGGWYARFNGRITVSEIGEEALIDAFEYGFTYIEVIAGLNRLDVMTGAILVIGSTGFVSSSLYGDVFGDENVTDDLFEADWASYESYSDSEDSEAI